MKLSLKNWNARAITQVAKLTIGKRIEVACILLQNDIKERISEPSPPRSAPGEAPHKETGRLRASISRRVDLEALKGWVGSNVLYFKMLELGTVKMEARPVLRPCLAENKEKIAQIVKGEA